MFLFAFCLYTQNGPSCYPWITEYDAKYINYWKHPCIWGILDSIAPAGLPSTSISDQSEAIIAYTPLKRKSSLNEIKSRLEVDHLKSIFQNHCR